MIIIPAIDIKDGNCVRLYQGKFDMSQVVAKDMLQTAKSFEMAGAEFIHMVDLDGALKGVPVNIDKVFNVKKEINVPIEFGGGVRSMEVVTMLIEGGISRVILGSAALRSPDFVKEAVKEYGNKVAVGLDARDGYLNFDGWLRTSNIHYLDFAKVMEDIGIDNIIFTDISRDGTLSGPNLDQLLKLKDVVDCRITASGGIKNIEDIKELKKLDVYGAITGKAIYSGTLDLVEAIKVCADCEV
jgi:phosphoribosylformimino-5-aminoimidazole carboxamide ribotide isomerase